MNTMTKEEKVALCCTLYDDFDMPTESIKGILKGMNLRVNSMQTNSKLQSNLEAYVEKHMGIKINV